MVAKPWFQRTILQEGLWNLSFFVDKDSILIEVWIFKNYMDNKMINAWTQVKSYHGHFERSQTVMFQTPLVIRKSALSAFHDDLILFLFGTSFCSHCTPP